jgi:hypothetical protein
MQLMTNGLFGDMEAVEQTFGADMDDAPLVKGVTHG